jgi:hypothetical protein
MAHGLAGSNGIAPIYRRTLSIVNGNISSLLVSINSLFLLSRAAPILELSISLLSGLGTVRFPSVQHTSYCGTFLYCRNLWSPIVVVHPMFLFTSNFLISL